MTSLSIGGNITNYTSHCHIHYHADCMAGHHEKRLLHDLLDTYNTLERPVVNESDPLQLSFGLTLMQIIDVDEKNQMLVTNIWLKLVSFVRLFVMRSAHANYGSSVTHTGMERHESAMEHLRLRWCQGSAHSAASHLEAGRTDVQQCWRGLRRHVSDECRRAQQWLVSVRAAGHIQVDVQDRHHMVSVRRSAMRNEVRQLDVRWVSGESTIQGFIII